MDKWFKNILPDKDPYHNRGRDQMRKKGGSEFECLWPVYPSAAPQDALGYFRVLKSPYLRIGT
jgi:hypothetical protein